MRIIGIDPGFEATGFGVIEVIRNDCVAIEWGVIAVSAADSLDRLIQVRNEVRRKAEVHGADYGAVEDGFVGEHRSSAIALAEARAAATIGLLDAGIKVWRYPPSAIKLSITGYGQGKKVDVAKSVQLMLSLDSVPTPDDASDALGVALTHWIRSS